MDETSEKGERIIFQDYKFLHAFGGKLAYLPFRNVEDYSSEKLKPFGFVEIKPGKMTYYPDEKTEKSSIDFTAALRRE